MSNIKQPVSELQSQIDDLKFKFSELEKYIQDQFAKVKPGKPGPMGPYGMKGDPGAPGRDGASVTPADLKEIAKMVRNEARLTAENILADIQAEIVSQMKNCGLMKEDGHAIFAVGLPGRDSNVPGPIGLTGAPGRDGVDGKDADISKVVALSKSYVEKGLLALNEYVAKKQVEFQEGLPALILQLLQ